jgi:hypothetical protein
MCGCVDVWMCGCEDEREGLNKAEFIKIISYPLFSYGLIR